MSLNVLVIPEDFRNDQFVLSPIIKRLFAEIGKPRARVQMCLDPLLGGISEALKWDRIAEIIDMYPLVQLFLLIVDRDGNPGRRIALDTLETRAAEKLTADRALICENAWQEIEVWAIAGQDFPQAWKWSEIRNEYHPKETYFQPLAELKSLTHEPGAGRTTLGREAAQNYAKVRARCPEDLQVLEKKIENWLAR